MHRAGAPAPGNRYAKSAIRSWTRRRPPSERPGTGPAPAWPTAGARRPIRSETSPAHSTAPATRCGTKTRIGSPAWPTASPARWSRWANTFGRPTSRPSVAISSGWPGSGPRWCTAPRSRWDCWPRGSSRAGPRPSRTTARMPGTRTPVTTGFAPAASPRGSAGHLTSALGEGMMMHQLREERSIGELFGQLTQDLSLLVRQEAQLAKTEIQVKVARAARDIGSLAAGGVVALMGGLALTAAIILLLIDPVGLKPWLAALIVAVVFGGGGWLMLQGGLKDLKNLDPTPRRTVESIKEDIQIAKEHRP